MPPNPNYHNPPLDANLYYSDPQTVTTSAASENYLDHKAANCFPSCDLVLILSGIGTGEQVTVKLQSDDNSSFSSATDVLTLGTWTSTPSAPLIFPLDNSLVTERYTRLYYTTTSGDSIPITAYLAPRP